MIFSILLWIFLILLFLLVLFLFLPIRYWIEGTTGSQTEVYAKITWFFRLLSVCYSYTSAETVFFAKIGPYTIPLNLLPASSKRNAQQKAVEASFKLSDIRPLLTSLDIKSIISLGIILIKKLMKRMKPKRFKLYGIIGFGDPCSTGQFLALYEAVVGAARLRSAIDLQGDFIKKKFALELNMAGCFTIASMIGPMIWFILQKPVRNAIKINTKKGR